MPEGVNEGVNMETAAAGGEDHISALPDELLLHLMSFLLSRDAVRTCVLAKRWRTLWKSVPTLRIDDPESYDGATGSSTFVDELLRLREPTPLDVCIISSCCMEIVDDDSDWDDEAFERMEPWLQYAVSCQVQELTVYFPLRVINMIFISSHLKRLNLNRMQFEGRSLDFSSCQVIEVLQMNHCEIFADIFSQSLKYLHMDSSRFDWDTRTYIFAPNLVGFRLGVDSGLTPFIHSMPSLVTASIILGEYCQDYCSCHNLSCDRCRGKAGDIDRSMVLKGLSGATNLELTIVDPFVFIFRKDLKWRPMFRNLKTLLLSDWCTANDFTGLVYFLWHSPVLETLTIDLEYCHREQQLVFETDESYNPSEQLLVSKHFKVVTILCQRREDEEIPHILKILGAHGVLSKQIVIQSMDEEN